MSPRWSLTLLGVVLLAVLLVLVALWTPWRPNVGAAIHPAEPLRDFTARQLGREDAYHAAVRPPAYVSLVLSLAFAVLLSVTPLGARLVARVAAPLGGGWVWQVLLGTVAVTLLGRLLVLPWAAWSESVQRRYGLSTRSWSGWAFDVAKGYAVGLALTLVVVLVVVALARR